MKQCIRCQQMLPKTAFHINNHKSLYTGKYTAYLASVCKECGKQQCQERRHSIQGMFTDIYNGQINSSKRRGHQPPDFTQAQLKTWIKSQLNYSQLLADWKKSNYNRWFKPSCDRIDNQQGYTLENLRLVSFQENSDAYKRDVVSGKATSTLKPVNQYNLHGELLNSFYSIQEAARQTSCAAGNILRCCRGEYKTSKGYVWRYVNE